MKYECWRVRQCMDYIKFSIEITGDKFKVIPIIMTV